MFQARHIANAGLAAYRAPIATIFGYDPTERFAYIGPMLTEDGEMFEETTVASNASKAAGESVRKHDRVHRTGRSALTFTGQPTRVFCSS
jgi:hypothetical protein